MVRLSVSPARRGTIGAGTRHPDIIAAERAGLGERGDSCKGSSRRVWGQRPGQPEAAAIYLCEQYYRTNQTLHFVAAVDCVVRQILAVSRSPIYPHGYFGRV